MIDLTFLSGYLVLVVVGVCLMVGYVIVKNPAFVKIIFLSFKRSPLDKYPHGTLKTLR